MHTWRWIFLLWLGSQTIARAEGPWSTYRGNPQRTGCADGKPGPASPKVLWTSGAAEHFIASPVPQSDRVYVTGLGAFNVATLSALRLEPSPKERVLWSRTGPFLKLPSVSSPAISGDYLVFGDGMHQTDGAILYCLDQKRGWPVWQLPVPGRLVHLEGGPTITKDRVYIGGGAAGVLCVDMKKVALEGKEMEISAVPAILDRKWKELLAKYEEEKKKDPDFAVPPREDQLPNAKPRVIWQKGADGWHVDAPVTVVGDRVLAASAFLDEEKVGDRALYCLDGANGNVIWRAALEMNPWGGASVQDDLVVVGGSTIGFYPKQLSKGRGEIVAFELSTGKEKWRKPVPGGVVSSVALTKDSAIATATDGKVRAFDLKTGLRKWIYDARAPFFAPPAVAGDTVYAADLMGVVHALDATTGRGKWTFNVGKQLKDPAPGMFYAGPVIQDGKLYAVTCNVEGPNVGKPTVVLCLGE